VRVGVLGFLTSGKGVNTRTDNLRVHTASSDTHTTSVGTTARSGWLEWRSHGCPKVMGTTSKLYTNKTKNRSKIYKIIYKFVVQINPRT